MSQVGRTPWVRLEKFPNIINSKKSRKASELVKLLSKIGSVVFYVQISRNWTDNFSGTMDFEPILAVIPR